MICGDGRVILSGNDEKQRGECLSMPIPGQPENLQRLSAKNIIYNALCDWIITGAMKPGEKLVDTELARHFNVSRTPVREAFQMLESQKLIQVLPGRATVVSDINMADIEKCYRLLAVIQGLAGELASDRLTAADLDLLGEIQKASAIACETDQPEAAIAADGQFHDVIMRVADNEYVTEFSRVMILHIQRIKYHYFHWDKMRKASARQHGEILDALRAGDGVRAGRLLQDHWLYAMDRCLNDVMEDQKSVVRDDRDTLTE